MRKIKTAALDVQDSLFVFMLYLYFLICIMAFAWLHEFRREGIMTNLFIQIAQLAVNILRLLYEIWHDRHESDS